MFLTSYFVTNYVYLKLFPILIDFDFGKLNQEYDDEKLLKFKQLFVIFLQEIVTVFSMISSSLGTKCINAFLTILMVVK